MTNERARANDFPRDGRPYKPLPIYEPGSDDPTATSPINRANQLRSMCKLLILAADSDMNIDLDEILPELGEVMFQLAEELRQHLEP